MKNNAVIKPLLPQDVGTLLEWAITEGWCPGTCDMGLYQKIDPKCLLGIYLGNRLVGTSAVFRHNPWFAFFGMYIVHPDYREQSLGVEMTRHRLHLAGYRNIGLNGGLDKASTYRRIGFRASQLIQRFSFSVRNIEEPEGLTDIKEIPLNIILKFEQKNHLFPGCRKRFLQNWLYHHSFIGRAVIAGGELQGYMLLRPSVNSMRIGPFLAKDPTSARKLLCSALHHSRGLPVHIDIPENNPDHSKIINEFNGKEGFATISMYRGYQPDLQHSAIYGLSALEAG